MAKSWYNEVNDIIHNVSGINHMKKFIQGEMVNCHEVCRNYRVWSGNPLHVNCRLDENGICPPNLLKE